MENVKSYAIYIEGSTIPDGIIRTPDAEERAKRIVEAYRDDGINAWYEEYLGEGRHHDD